MKRALLVLSLVVSPFAVQAADVAPAAPKAEIKKEEAKKDIKKGHHEIKAEVKK